jgi:hypothetical protein
VLQDLFQIRIPFWTKVQGLFHSLTAGIVPDVEHIAVSPTVPASGRRLCIFSHYDRWNRVDPHVLHHLRQLASLGCDLVFVTSSRDLSAQNREEILACCHKLIIRKNVGYDFGSYRAGLKEMAWAQDYEQIVLVNDSVYGPFHDLGSIFEHFSHRDADLWSITDSYEHEYHLQSYFLVFNRKAWQHPRIQKFWKSMVPVRKKNLAIHLYELGLSRTAKRSGLRLAAWCDYDQVTITSLKKASARMATTEKEEGMDPIEKRRLQQLMDASLGQPCNISHFFWDFLIQDHQCPYLKVELLRDNPMGVSNVNFYRDYLPSGYPKELIEQHVRNHGR